MFLITGLLLPVNGLFQAPSTTKKRGDFFIIGKDIVF